MIMQNDKEETIVSQTPWLRFTDPTLNRCYTVSKSNLFVNGMAHLM